jgi:iron complex outermembrane recepter protein
VPRKHLARSLKETKSIDQLWEQIKMGKNRVLQHAIRAVIAAAAASAAAPAAFSQTAATTTAAAGASTELQEVVVTGTRIQSANLISSSPITTVSAVDIANTGMNRVEDILNNLPQVFASQGSTLSNGADGTATINLHDLGVQRTLVLVNGKRLAPGAPDGRNYADVNQIPAELVERVDVLTGGASSTYGADAVSGVVNFVMNTHYEGVKLDAQYGMYNHDNTDTYLQSLTTAHSFPTPTGSVNSAFEKSFSVIAGSNFADGAGNATMYVTYDNQARAVGGQFDYSACSLSWSAAKKAPVCGGSETNAYGTVLGYNSTGNIITSTFHNGALVPYASTDAYNFGALNYYMRPGERWTAGGFINVDINEHVNTYAEIMYMRNSSTSQIGPSGDFGANLLTLSCAGPGQPGYNPLPTAAERATLCDPALLAAQGPASVAANAFSFYLLRRNAEGGGRQTAYFNDDWRTVVGVKGDFATAFKYDVSAQIGITDATTQDLNYFSNENLLNAEIAVVGPGGTPVCATGPATCSPYNFWVPGGVTQAALNYLQIPLQTQGTAREYVVSGNITGDFGKYGVQTPWAKSGLQVNGGTEYRSESTDFNPDLASQEGLGAGGPGDVLPIAGNFHVWEAFAEFNMPILDGAPFADQLAVSGGYRYSSYTLGFTTNTYKFGVEWAPIKDVRFRGTYNQAVRAPNISELYTSATIGPNGTIDPCWGPVGANGLVASGLTQAQCALAGVSAAQYGHLAINPASQFNTQTGGNPLLSPEIAHTWSYGVVFQPSFLPNFSTTIDYYDIRITGAIESQSGTSVILNCALTGSAQNCGYIHRNAFGSLWLTNDGFVVTGEQNTGVKENQGVDINVHYSLPLDTLGKLTFNLQGTDNIKNTTQPNVSIPDPATGGIIPGPEYNCTGYYGPTCGNPLPRWRHVFSADWATPWQGLDLNARWRYIGPSQVESLSQDSLISNPGTIYPGYDSISAYNYLDLVASVAVTDKVTIRVGANNVLDKDPPIVLSGNCPTGPCNNNTWSQVYDPIGRFLYVHLTAKF